MISLKYLIPFILLLMLGIFSYFVIRPMEKGRTKQILAWISFIILIVLSIYTTFFA
ncbi:Uncharacterised protein [Streptococcus criceti]|uniref:Uncharacterized protein n=1 Tax=Streptococcus criceti HS-6 TaxID=873449 RepID=G5JS12_STRCG|nr:hypothetical protein STRCR_2092 [Streptococcus criceti HS-6]SUN42829.1 Uncharacterised protein [Streptococcus criceti]